MKPKAQQHPSLPLAFTVIPSPVGPLTLEASPRGLRGIYWDSDDHGLERSRYHIANAEAPPFPEARRQLAAYFAGRLRRFALPLDPQGTPFQLRAWEILRRIPYGETIAYGQQAQQMGHPKAVRAIGLANGKNPISIIVPCHRVIGKNGQLTGYGGGLDRKRFLLDLERGSLF